MGRDLRSRESGVKKTAEKLTGSIIGSAGGSSKTNRQDKCLFSFDGVVKVKPNLVFGVTKSSPVSIIPHHTNLNKLELFLGSINTGTYRGVHKAKILDCIKRNYVYEGLVKDVKKTSTHVQVHYHIEGKGR